MRAEEVRSFPSQKPFRSSPMTMNEYTGQDSVEKNFTSRQSIKAPSHDTGHGTGAHWH